MKKAAVLSALLLCLALPACTTARGGYRQATAPGLSTGDMARLESAVARAEEAAQRAELAAEKAEVIFHKSLQK